MALIKTPVPPETYSIDSFARTFGMGRSLVFKEIAVGRLKARKVGRRTLILRSDALAYLHSLPVREVRARKS